MQARVFRGLTNNRRGEQQLALADYDAALKIDPDNVDALVDRAAIYATDGKPKRALADFNAALAVEPDNPTALYNRGYVHFSLHDYDQALSDYDAAIALDPTMALAYNNRCLVRAIVGRELVKALADCDTALKLAPLNLDVRETRGFVYLKLGEPAIAIKEYDAAIAIDPNQVIALYGRGLARLQDGQCPRGRSRSGCGQGGRSDRRTPVLDLRPELISFQFSPTSDLVPNPRGSWRQI